MKRRTYTLKIPAAADRKLRLLARDMGVQHKELLDQALEDYLTSTEPMTGAKLRGRHGNQSFGGEIRSDLLAEIGARARAAGLFGADLVREAVLRYLAKNEKALKPEAVSPARFAPKPATMFSECRYCPRCGLELPR